MKKNIPEELLLSLENVKGFEKKAFIETHASGEQVTSIRLNPAKNSKSEIHNVKSSRIPWSTDGFYLAERPSFTSDPLFHAGAYYVQEASSMFLEQALRQTTDLTQPLRVLDLCAAPGGKSTLIHSLISSESLLVSNEIIKARVNILAENLIKWGVANIIITNNQPKDFERLPGFFDVMGVDAPCSGSGLFRKDADAIDHWSLDSVAMCARRQKDILADAVDALKPGGVLIYSTCSYSTAENEEIADWLTAKDFASLPLNINEAWGIVETMSPQSKAAGYRFYPDQIKGEGFFLAAFKKQSGEVDDSRPPKNKMQAITAKELSVISPLIKTEHLHFAKWEEHILALPSSVFAVLPLFQLNLYVKKAGVNVGSVIRDELIPHHELAMSGLLSEVGVVEVDEATSLNFLRKKNIEIESQQKGWLLVSYKETALGWIKNMGNRINNYYPKEWRILNK